MAIGRCAPLDNHISGLLDFRNAIIREYLVNLGKGWGMPLGIHALEFLEAIIEELKKSDWF